MDEIEFGNESELAEHFHKAAKHMASLVSRLPPEKLLYFYARYKQATEGDCNISRPNLFNVNARKKRDAWNDLLGKSKQEAMTEYITAIKEADPDWDGESDGAWVRVSRMPPPKPNHGSLIQTNHFLEAIKSNNLAALRSMPLERLVKEVYEDGMTGLHWASDHGLAEVASLLLVKGADVNAQDESGQTALHYASSCGHKSVIEVLLAHTADQSILDEDGQTASKVADEDCLICFTAK